MNRISDSKGVYAQSSDIKSRSYLEYRRDMKKKAIAELEIIDWFEEKLKRLHNTNKVMLSKSGGDAHMWFLRSGKKISGEPDYVACINGEKKWYEFQYANQDDLPFYDFKVSKVGRKIKGKRIPHTDRDFLYIIKPICKFAILSPQWVAENGTEAGVPAWGSRTALRVPGDIFKTIFEYDNELSKVIETINIKNQLLEMQSSFIQKENDKFSNELQKIVDQKKEYNIIPETLDGFYEACFLMDSIKEYPKNHSLWLVFGASFYSDQLNSLGLARLIYSLDFLYGGSDELEENTLNVFVETMQKITIHLAMVEESKFKTNVHLSPHEEVVNFLFAVNLYEDIVQELRFLYNVVCFPSISKIFQSINDVCFIANKYLAVVDITTEKKTDNSRSNSK